MYMEVSIRIDEALQEHNGSFSLAVQHSIIIVVDYCAEVRQFTDSLKQ